MEKILIIKTSSLGDIIHTYPTIDYLRKAFPSAQIDWVVERPFAELVQSHPQINDTLTIATKMWRHGLLRFSTYQEMRDARRYLRRKRYDVAFDLQGNIKSGIVLSQVQAVCKVGFGRKSAAEWPNTFFTHQQFDPPSGKNIREDYLSVVKSFFRDSTPHHCSELLLTLSDIQRAMVQSILSNPLFEEGPKVIVCPGSAWKNKQMTTEAIIVFLSELHKHLKCKFLLLWGTLEEREIVFHLHQEFIQDSVIIDRMSLPVVQNLMSGADLVIAMDSLPLHLAGTTATPTCGIFGPSNAEKYRPLGARHFTFQGSCPYERTFEKRCPILRTCPTGACTRELSGGGELFASFFKWWKALLS